MLGVLKFTFGLSGARRADTDLRVDGAFTFTGKSDFQCILEISTLEMADLGELSEIGAL